MNLITFYISLLVYWTLLIAPIPSNGMLTDAGISIDLTDKALTYFSRLAEVVAPKILGDVGLPNVTGTGYSITHMRIDRVTPPDVKAAFISSEGFVVRVTLPTAILSGRYKVGFGWVSAEGKMGGILSNFTFDGVISIKRGRVGHPILKIYNCSTGIGNINLTFHGSWTSHVGNYISGVIAGFIRDYLTNLICWIAYQATRELNSTGPGYCETHEAYTNVGGELQVEKTDFSVNFSLIAEPSFSDWTASMGLNGTILYRGRSSPVRFHSIKPHGNLNPRKMARVTITDYVGNSFFYHAKRYEMAKINQTLSARRLPRMLWGPFGFLCRKCMALIQGGMTAPPELKIMARKGVRLGIHGWVRSLLFAFHRHTELFRVNTYIGVNVYPYVSRGKLFANTLLNDIRISTRDAKTSLSRVFGFSMKGLIGVLKSFLPAQIKPPVQRDLKKVFGKKGGMPLPSFCGIHFRNPRIFYIEDAIVIDADLSFDTRPLVKMLRELIETGGQTVSSTAPTKEQ